MLLDYLALFFLIFASIVIFYAVIAIHDIPYEMALKRNHPHAEAIHYAGWVSLFTLHIIWPFLWIWATLWQKDKGWGDYSQIKSEKALQAEQNAEKEAMEKRMRQQQNELEAKFILLQQQIERLEKKLAQSQSVTVSNLEQGEE